VPIVFGRSSVPFSIDEEWFGTDVKDHPITIATTPKITKWGVWVVLEITHLQGLREDLPVPKKILQAQTPIDSFVMTILTILLGAPLPKA
jgi:hypothetical protein